MNEREQLEQTIAALEAQRATLGDVAVDTSIAALREKLAALEPAPPAGQQRKQITILFADLSGFTPLSETMDAEDVNEIINALWERLDKIIVVFGGRIDKHMGDAVMALWGIPVAREDDPEQAVRAALAMQAALAAFREERRLELPMRIGINTGPVLLGQVGTTGEYTAIGDTVNTASRLEHKAPAGGILISHDTYWLVRGIFDVQPLEPVQVKGKAEPIQVYTVQGAKPRAFRRGSRGVAGIETRMIGREAELERLQAALHMALEEHRRQMITVSGEAGVGKSRLLDEFEDWIDLLPERIRFFKGRASVEMQTLPYALLRDLFSFRFQIRDSDAAALVREKMARGIGEVLGEEKQSQMKAHFIGQLLGFDFGDSPHLHGVVQQGRAGPRRHDDAQQLRDRALIYLRQFFQATTDRIPAVIFVEDAHWADDSSLDVIDYLARTLPDQRLLIVCLARPTLFERRPGWGAGQAFHSQLELNPLSDQNSSRLVQEILKKVDQVPTTLQELVVRGAEGNPFYVEELIKMLIDDGVIVMEQDRWRVEPGRLTRVRIPPTLTGILQARLDSLPLEERMVLQQASAVGRTFWDSAVVQINQLTKEVIGEQEIPLTLSALRAKEMIFPHDAPAFAGTQEYLFKHAILREVTYESVLKRVRLIYHAIVAEWLIECSGERVGEVAGLIADHLELAGQTERSAYFLRRAGERAALRFAHAEAVAYLSRALDLTPATEYTERYALLLAREQVHNLQGQRDAQSADLAALEALAETLDDDERRIEVALCRARFANATGNYPAAIEASGVAIHLARTLQDAEDEAMGCRQWGSALLAQGDYEAARTQFERAVTLARAAGSRQVEAHSLNSLAGVPHYQGDHAQAMVYWEQALHTFRQIGDRRGESRVLNNLGVTAWCQSDSDQARFYYEQALGGFREIGDRRSEGWLLINLGRVVHQEGNLAEAIPYYEEALDIFNETGDRRGEGQALGDLGRVALLQGDCTRALAYHQQSLDICREIGDQHNEGWSLLHLGRVFHQEGDLDNAVAHLEQALGIFRKMGHKRGESLVLANLGDLTRARDDYEGATAFLELALVIARECSDRQTEGWALSYSGFISADLGDYARARAYHEQALDIYREIGDRQGEGWGLANLGHIFYYLGDHELARDHCQEALRIAQELDNRPEEGYALANLGQAFRGLGRFAEAAAAYQRAIALQRKMGHPRLAMRPLAGLAAVSLALGDLDQAQAHVEEILDYLETEALDNTEEPLWIYLVCYRVLCEIQDPRAPAVLHDAVGLLQERAAKISDGALRRSFLENVAAHQEIEALLTNDE